MTDKRLSSLNRCASSVALVVAAAALSGCSSNDNPAGPTTFVRDGFTVTMAGDLIAGHEVTLTVTHAPSSDSILTFGVNFPLAGFASAVPCYGADYAEVCAFPSTNIRCPMDAALAQMTCVVRLHAFTPGPLTLTLAAKTGSSASATTSLSFTVAAQRATAIRAVDPSIFVPSGTATPVRIAVVDQRGKAIRGVTLTATSLDAGRASVASVVEPDVTDTLTTSIVSVQPKGVGAARIGLAVGALTTSIPVMLGAVGDDSAVVTHLGRAIDVGANDASGITNITIVMPPAHGQATITRSSMRFTPASGFFGRDSVRYVGTASGRTDTAFVRFAVMPGPYTVRDIASAAGLRYDQTSMNDSGEIGALVTRDDGSKCAIRWAAGGLDTLQSTSAPTGVFGIDNAGTVYGVVDGQAVRWRKGATEPESVLPLPTRPLVSDRLHVSLGGTVLIPASQVYLVRGASVDSVSISDLFEYAAVDDRGDFAAREFNGGFYPAAKVRYADGTIIRLGLGGRGLSVVSAMNNRAAVVGTAEIVVHRVEPFFSDHGESTILSAIYPVTSANALNDDDWMLGSGRAPVVAGPALFGHGVIAAVQSLLAEPAITVADAWKVNNANQVLVVANDQSGASRLMLLTQMP